MHTPNRIIATVPTTVTTAWTELPAAAHDGAGSTALAPLAGVATTVVVPAGHELFDQDDDVTHCYQIVSGCIRTVRLMEDGRRQIGGFLMQGDLLGFDAGEAHDEAAQAVTETVMRRFPVQAVLAHSGRDVTFARWLWRQAARQLHRARDHAMLLGRKTATERVASFLCDMQSRAAHDAQGWIELPMHRADIADHLGLTVETVSRTLTQLRRGRVIDTMPGKISIRAARQLADMASDAQAEGLALSGGNGGMLRESRSRRPLQMAAQPA